MRSLPHPATPVRGLVLTQPCAFGLRPRRATGRPPRPSASASVKSSSRTPFRASANVMRTVAPLPSGISAPDMSETRIVFRAIRSSFDTGLTRGEPSYYAHLGPDERGKPTNHVPKARRAHLSSRRKMRTVAASLACAKEALRWRVACRSVPKAFGSWEVSDGGLADGKLEVYLGPPALSPPSSLRH